MTVNRAILLTAPGVSAIAVVRLVGPGVAEFLHKHFSAAAKANRCVHGTLRDDQTVIDDPVVVRSEDGCTADINLHGGTWIVRCALVLAERAGFAVEKSAGAIPLWATDGTSIIEREMLADLPKAKTELAVRVLLAQPAAWSALEKTGALEASAPVKNEATRDRLFAMLKDRALEYLIRPPRVAIIGVANAGKSTLANQLFAQERSITADLPGTTRDWVGEIANIDGLAVMLVDTPGLRATSDPIERAAIEQSREQIQSADLVLLVLDASRPLEPEQSSLLRAYPSAIRVLNKSDRPHASGTQDLSAISTVATSGDGLDELRVEMRRYFGCESIDDRIARCWTSRQRELVQRAIRFQNHGALKRAPQAGRLNNKEGDGLSLD